MPKQKGNGNDGQRISREHKRHRPSSPAESSDDSSTDDSFYDVSGLTPDEIDVKSLLLSLNKKMDKNLQASKNIRKDVSDLKKTINSHGMRLDKAETGISRLESAVDHINGENELIQTELKKVNLILCGVDDDPHETEPQLHSKNMGVFAIVTPHNFPIDTYYRLGNYSDTRKRPIKVRFLSIAQRNIVYDNRSKLSPPLYTNEDLPYNTRRASSILRNKKKEAMANGTSPDEVTINYKLMQITIKNQPYCIQSLVTGKIIPTSYTSRKSGFLEDIQQMNLPRPTQ